MDMSVGSNENKNHEVDYKFKSGIRFPIIIVMVNGTLKFTIWVNSNCPMGVCFGKGLEFVSYVLGSSLNIPFGFGRIIHSLVSIGNITNFRYCHSSLYLCIKYFHY